MNDINQWQIEGLKGVGDVELNLDSEQRVFAFLGTNGVGKTKALETLSLHFLPLIPNSLNDTDFIDNIDKILKNQRYAIEYNGNYNFQAWAYLGANKRSYIQKNQEIDPLLTYRITKSNEILGKILNEISNGNFAELGMNEDIRQWFIERARFVNRYQIEKDDFAIHLDAILKCLHTLDNAFDKEFFQLDKNDNVYLKVNDERLELNELSSGFLSLVKIIQSIIAYYYAFTGEKDLLNIKGVVLIDEIESHLHLEWQVKIIPILKNLFPNTTFYITTHSPLVLSQLNEGEAYLLKRDDDNVVRSHLINSPNTRTLSNVLIDAFGINLNQLKIDNIANIDQRKAKNKLLELLDK